MRRALFIMLAMSVVYCGADIFRPLHRDLRQFDPASVAKLETRMWRSYYERQPLALFLDLSEMLRTQSQFPLLRSYVGAYYGTMAAFVFKQGQQRADFEKALPELQAYFGMLRNTGSVDLDVRRAAELELEWWIVHRHRAGYPVGALGRACAAASAYVYQLAPDAALAHGQLRAAAMLVRDERADAGRLSEADWSDIEALLLRSYQVLQRALVPAVAAPPPPAPLQG